jgi:N-methylhydantoinase A
VGLLLAEFRYDAVRSFVTSLDRLDRAGMGQVFADLREDVQTAMAAQNIKSAPVLRDYVDVRYKGQEKSLTLEFAALHQGGSPGEQIGAAFTAAHFSLFGYRRNDPLEIVALRVRGMAGVDDISMADIARSQASGSAVESSRRMVCFDPKIGMIEIQTMPRSALQSEVSGPLIVEERDTSIVVPPGWSARADELRNVILERTPESQR